MTAVVTRASAQNASPRAAILDELPVDRVGVAVHDATRVSWDVTVPLPSSGAAAYTFELELELPENVVFGVDPWGALQAYARLQGLGERDDPSPDAFRRQVVDASSRLARAREGFVRHCTLLRASQRAEDDASGALLLWLDAAITELARARSAQTDAPAVERALADELLSVELWTVLTDCARALFDTERALAERSPYEAAALDVVHRALATALKGEIAYRRRSQFPLAEPSNDRQLERLLARRRLLKKHFERVLFLEATSYQLVNRLAGWFSAFAAMLAYLWFFFWQVTLERHPAAIGSGVVALALLTAVAYASRERLKEAGRSWLAGRAQRMFAQRVTRYRVPSNERARGAVVVSARESFSQSTARRPDPLHADLTQHVTLLRYVHNGEVARPAVEPRFAREVRLVYRLDLSSLLPRLHDAVRGLATPGPDDRIAIVDVPRNYDLPLRARLRADGVVEEVERVLVLNKNGLVRIVDERARPAAQCASLDGSRPNV